MSEDLLVDGYDYNPHTCEVDVPYGDYCDMKDKLKENKQLKDQLQQKENIIKEFRELADKYEMGKYDYSVPCFELKEILDKEKQ